MPAGIGDAGQPFGLRQNDLVRITLATSIDRLYTAFAEVPRPPGIDHCPCCLTPDQVAELLAPVPLRELPADVVGDYAAHVLATSGGVEDFRYFLPRILHIALTEGFDWPDVEVVAARLRVARWWSWPDAQHGAVRQVLAASP